MSPPLPVLASRLAALALLALPLLGAYALLVYPHTHLYSAARAELTETRERLERFRRLAAAEETVERALAETRSAQRASGAFLSGTSDALAAAAMQNRLDTAVRAAGGAVRSVRSLPAQERDGLVEMRLRVQLSTTVHGLARLLYALETGRPHLFVDGLELRARLTRTSESGERLAVAPEIQLDLTVAGYRLPEATS